MRFMNANLSGQKPRPSKLDQTIFSATLPRLCGGELCSAGTEQSPVTSQYKLQHADELSGKFIYHPIVLASLDYDYFRRFTADVGASKSEEHDRETVLALMSMAARDLKRAVGTT